MRVFSLREHILDTENNKENQTEIIKKQEKNGNGNKKTVLKRVLTIVLAVVGFCAAFAGGYFSNYIFNSRNSMVARDIVSIMEDVGYIYDPVTGEEREITEKEVAYALVNAMLDDYAAYYTAEEYKAVKENAKGNYGGIGIAFFDRTDLAIDQIPLNSPSDRAGLKMGDVLLSAVNSAGETVNFNTVEDLMNFIGTMEINKPTEFGVLSGDEIKTVTLAKENYVKAYVYYCDSAVEYKFLSDDSSAPKGKEIALNNSMITDDSVGYIRLDGFEGGAASQMGDALKFMKNRGKTKLILDLRDNGGGYMNVLAEIASYFVDNGGVSKSPIAYAVGKSGTEAYSTDKNRFSDFLDNMVILGNKNTASASECLIGAIVTYGDLVSGVQNVIVEKDSLGVAKTYGKGIMQTTYYLVSGGAFKLTTAKITWPDKETCIHGVGVTEKMGATVAEKGTAVSVAIDALKN